MAIIKVQSKGKTYQVKVDSWFKKAIKNRSVSINSGGYAQLGRDRNGRWLSVHAGVIGHAPEGYQIDHINRDKLDCRLDNLRFVTRSVNSRHKRANIFSWMDLTKSIINSGRVLYRKPAPPRSRVQRGIYKNGFGQFEVIITANGKTKQHGTYPCADSAYQVWVEKQIEMGRYV